MDNETDMYDYIAFETNITQFPQIKTRSFPLSGDISHIYCYFVKDESTPLYLLCETEAWGNFSLGNRGFIQNDIHYKYNFILPSQGLIHDYFIFHHAQVNYINELIYPNILDFSSKNTLNISIVGAKSSLIIRLNKEGENLYCEDVCEESKNNNLYCTPKNHFTKAGTYFVQTKNNVNKFFAHYDLFGVKVYLSNDDKKDENSGNYY